MDREKLKQQLLKDWQQLIEEYNSDFFGSQVPERFARAFRILQNIFIAGKSIRQTAKLLGWDHKTVREVYVNRYISTYQKYALLGEVPESVNILKEAFDRKAGRPRKDYIELAKQLKEGNPLLWDRLIKGITSYRVRGKDEKPIFLSKEKLRKVYGQAVEEFLGERLNQKTLWAKFIDAVVKVEFGAWYKLYAKVLPYKLYMKFVESQRAKNRKLPTALGFGWEYVLDITEVTPDLTPVKEGQKVERSYYILAASDTYSGLILGVISKKLGNISGHSGRWGEPHQTKLSEYLKNLVLPNFVESLKCCPISWTLCGRGQLTPSTLLNKVFKSPFSFCFGKYLHGIGFSSHHSQTPVWRFK